MKTVLITGCSSGFGLQIARYFLDQGWSVIATMRHPSVDLLPACKQLRVLALDVTDPDSIHRVMADAGPVDALVNNAGIGWLNPLEGAPMSMTRKIIETNTLGTMAMTQAVLPQFRRRRAGVIVNISSIITVQSLPLLSVYAASKAAVNAFTESMALELAPFNIRMGLVLPGRAPTTRFGDNARALMGDGVPAPYLEMVQAIFAGWEQSAEPITTAQEVAEAVWRVVTDETAPLRLPAGADAKIAMAAT